MRRGRSVETSRIERRYLPASRGTKEEAVAVGVRQRPAFRRILDGTGSSTR